MLCFPAVRFHITKQVIPFQGGCGDERLQNVCRIHLARQDRALIEQFIFVGVQICSLFPRKTLFCVRLFTVIQNYYITTVFRGMLVHADRIPLAIYPSHAIKTRQSLTRKHKCPLSGPKLRRVGILNYFSFVCRILPF